MRRERNNEEHLGPRGKNTENGEEKKKEKKQKEERKEKKSVKKKIKRIWLVLQTYQDPMQTDLLRH